MQRQLATALSEHGFRVDTVGTGAEVLEVINKVEYDLVLLNTVLPIIDGFEVVKQIRKESTIPIIGIISENLDGKNTANLDADFNEYITKPIDYQNLVNRLETWEVILYPQQNNYAETKLSA